MLTTDAQVPTHFISRRRTSPLPENKLRRWCLNTRASLKSGCKRIQNASKFIAYQLQTCFKTLIWFYCKTRLNPSIPIKKTREIAGEGLRNCFVLATEARKLCLISVATDLRSILSIMGELKGYLVRKLREISHEIFNEKKKLQA